MRSTIFRQMAYLPLLALALTPIASASAAVSVKNSTITECQVWNFETEASDLLKQIKSLSGKLKDRRQHSRVIQVADPPELADSRKPTEPSA